MRRTSQATQWILGGAIALGGLILGAGFAAASQDVQMTAGQGEVSELSTAQAGSAEGQNLETGEDGGCSVLLDRNAVVELCGRTRLSFKKDERRGTRIINVESGSVRLVVEPRTANQRIEIHTPAAIATILGTIVFVTVDPVTGETTISSSESDINIRSRDEQECTPRGLPAEAGLPECAEGTTITALEQLSITPGEVSKKRKLSRAQINELGGCLFDFHDLAIEIGRTALEGRVAGRVAMVDATSVGTLPGVGLGGPASSDGPPEADFDDSSTPDDVLEPIDGNEPPDTPAEPNSCPTCPSEHLPF